MDSLPAPLLLPVVAEQQLLSEGTRRILRDTGIEFLTRVMGLLLAAIAVQFVAEGIRGLVQAS